MTPVIGVIASSIFKAGTSFESIATANGTGLSGTITFSSIPSTYKSLQIRAITRSDQSFSGAGSTKIQFNGDTAGNYANGYLFGANNTTVAVSSSGNTEIRIDKTIPFATETPSQAVGVLLIDIIDYASTTKKKTLRSFSGFNNNQVTYTSDVRMTAGTWSSTSAINSISLTAEYGSFTTATSFALYGIRG